MWVVYRDERLHVSYAVRDNHAQVRKALKVGKIRWFWITEIDKQGSVREQVRDLPP
jgi:hypothetical protein